MGFWGFGDFEDEDFAKTSWDRASLPVGAGGRLLRHPAHPSPAARDDPRRSGRRRRIARTTPTRSTSRAAPSSPTPSGAHSRTGMPSCRRTTRRRSGCSAWSSGTPIPAPSSASWRVPQRISASEARSGALRCGVWFGTPGERTPDPFFEGEGPRSHRLHTLRQLHGRMPCRREEHADEELPRPRGAPRRGDRAAPHGHRGARARAAVGSP